MAKQKNIKIVYQVDTSQVKAAEASVNKAKAATDKLKDSTKQLGTQSTQTNKQIGLSYEQLRANMLAVQDAIRMTASTDKARLNELIPKYRELKSQVDALNKSIEGTAKSGAAVGVSLGNIYNSVRLALTAGLIKETASAVIEMTALAGKIEGVKKAFDKLPSSILLMEQLKQRTHGALTELELMQKALQARNFGIPIEQLGKLLEFAAIKSQQTGVSIQYLTDSIITGLGRESIKILDNLQIDIGALKKRMEETGLSMREVVGDIVNEELRKMGGYLETGEAKVNRLKASWKGLGEIVATELQQPGIIDFLDRVVKAFGAFSMGGVNTPLVKQLQAAREEAARNVTLIQDSKKDLSEQIGLAEEELRIRKETIGQLKSENALYEEKNSLVDRAILSTIGANSAKQFDQNKKNIDMLEFETKIYSIQIKMLNDLVRNQEIENELNEASVVTIDSLNKKIDDYNEKIQNTNIQDKTRLTQLENLRDQTIAYRDALENLNKPMPDGESEPTFELTGDLAQKRRDIGAELAADTARTWEEINRESEQGMKDAHDLDVQAIKDADDAAKRREQIYVLMVNTAINAAHGILSAFSESRNKDENQTVEHLENQLSRSDDFYAGLLDSAGNNERRKEEIQRQGEQKRQELQGKIEQAEIAAEERNRVRERNARLRQIAIDTAAGIVRALTIKPGLPDGGPIALFLAAEGLAQAAVVRKFKKGVIDLDGAGNETSDSIPARLSKHESVMTAEETKSSMNILKGIRARKLDDRIFEKLVVKSPAMRPTDLSPVVSELQRNRPVGIVTQGVQIYEVMEKRKGLKKRIRNASGF